MHPFFEFFDDFSCLGEELTNYSFVYILTGSFLKRNVHLNPLYVQSMCMCLLAYLITSDIWKNPHCGHELLKLKYDVSCPSCKALTLTQCV